MGCNSSKISKTPVEIIRIRQEVKASVKWWKRKKKECSKSSNSTQSESPAYSLELPSTNDTFDSSQFTQDPKRNAQTNVDWCQTSLKDGLSETDVSCEKNSPTKSVEIHERKSSIELTSLPPLCGCRSKLEDDLKLEDFDDSFDLSDDMEQLTRKTEASTPTAGHHVPLIVHTAWSDFSVRQRNNLLRSKSTVNKFSGSRERQPGEAGVSVKRKRPMAAKGERQRPKLTEVYDAELSLPGIIVPSPKQKQEESCLNAWMTGRLGDEC